MIVMRPRRMVAPTEQRMMSKPTLIVFPSDFSISSVRLSFVTSWPSEVPEASGNAPVSGSVFSAAARASFS